MLFRFLGRLVKLNLLFSFILSCSYAVAEQSDMATYGDENNLEQRLIRRNIEISEWFDGVAERIDLFFVGKKVTSDRNQTRVTVENITNSMEHKSLTNHTSIGVFPRFPNLEKYWALKFTTYDEKEARQDLQNNYIRQNATRRTNYGATVGWFRKFGTLQTAFEPRIELQDPLRISHSLSFYSTANFTTYDVRPKIEFYASARRGPGSYQALDFDFFLSKKWVLRLINEGDYLDKTRTYSTSNGFIFGQSLSRKSIMSYGLIFNANNRPDYHLDGYVASVSYNEMVYKKIFDYTITPYLEFSKAHSFKGEVGAVLNLRVTF
jgi:hypothetical protein